jgi:hemerythrin-like domain-containing protein
MKATEILIEEHKVIERVLGVLETAAQRLESGDGVRLDLFIEVTDFIKGFADGCHHKKEEDVLFKAMVAHGVPVENGPIDAMLAEHEQGRAYTRAMREAAQGLKTGKESARSDILHYARRYITLLRQHIAKENEILFPLADRAIPQAKHAEVAAGFDHVEHDETGPGVHEKYLALVTDLESEIEA